MKKILNVLFLLWTVPYLYGQFGPRNIIENGFYKRITGIVTADINHDNYKDIVITQNSPVNQISYYLNQNGEGFGNQQIIMSDFSSPLSLTAGDFNDDGLVDIVSATTASGVSDQNLYLFINNDGSSFSTQTIDMQSDPVDYIFGLQTSDIDNDGDQDIIAFSDIHLIVYYNDGTGSFTKTIVPPGITAEYYVITVKDINNDGWQDVIAGSAQTIVYKNNAGQLIYDNARTNSISNDGLVFLAHLNDMDGDGDNDLIISGDNQSDIRWYANDGSGFFSLSGIIQTGISQCESLVTEDFDADGDIDIVTGFRQTGKIVWYENINNTGFSSENIIYTGTPPHPDLFFSDDLNNDGLKDIVWAEELSYHLNNTNIGLETFTGNRIFQIFPNPSSSLLQIKTGTGGKLSVFHSTGQIIYPEIELPAGTHAVETRLNPGIYYIRFDSSRGALSKKVIIR